MSVHGGVYCACYQQGLWPQTSIPPSVIAVTGAGEVVLASGAEIHRDAFRAWKQAACLACGHPGQRHCYERVAVYSDWVAFERALKKGNHQLLLAMMENAEASGDAWFPLAQTEELLQHLRQFRDLREVDWLPGVIDVQTRELLKLNECTISNLRVVIEGESDGSGKILIEKQGQRVFASSHFEIIKTPQGYTYRDLTRAGTKRGVFCQHCLLKDGVTETRALEIIPMALHGTDYAEVIDSLERLCVAALETRHPIVWE